ASQRRRGVALQHQTRRTEALADVEVTEVCQRTGRDTVHLVEELVLQRLHHAAAATIGRRAGHARTLLECLELWRRLLWVRTPCTQQHHDEHGHDRAREYVTWSFTLQHPPLHHSAITTKRYSPANTSPESFTQVSSVK